MAYVFAVFHWSTLDHKFDRGYFNFFQKTMKTLRPVPHTVISQIPTIEIVGLGTLFVQLKNRTARS
jgi:hypothetical protein